MSERDELAAVIVAAYGEDASECPCEQDFDVADGLLAAGYRKPRPITTAEELDALDLRAIVRDGDDETWELTDNGWRYWMYDETFVSLELTLPAAVLWEPQP